jgi:AcrR family transcriptional regulator
MTGAVRSRTYDNSRRAAQAEQTRARVVDAARALFVERGYVATTLEVVAEQSDVSLPTVYRLFRSKRGILDAILETSGIGGDDPTPFFELPQVRRVLDEPDARVMLEHAAVLAARILAHEAPMQEVLQSAARLDPDASDALTMHMRQRFEGLPARIARALAERGALRPGVDEGEALDILYTLMSPDTYRVFTVERGWTRDRFARWAGSALPAMLLAARP